MPNFAGMNATHFLSFTKSSTICLALFLGLCSCKKTFDEPANRLIADKIIADYVAKELKGAPYVLYLYTDTNSNHLYLQDDDRQFESGRSYIYFIDEDPTASWPHPCRSVWIDRNHGSLTVQRGDSPLRGSEQWLLINNLWNEPPHTGSSGCLPIGHPDYVVQPCFYYQFEGDNLLVEHQCIEMSSSSVELAISIDQSNHRLGIMVQDPDTIASGAVCIKHYGFSFHLDSLYVPVDSVNTARLEEISVRYRVSSAFTTGIDRSFTIPTQGSGKINL